MRKAVYIVLAAVLFLAFLHALLPLYLEKKILPRLAAEAGLGELHCQVRRISPFGADISGIRLVSNGRRELTAASLRLDYSPAGLIHGRLGDISVDGLRLYAEVAGSGLEFPLFSRMKNKSEGRRSPPENGSMMEILPLLPQEIHFFDAAIHLSTSGEAFSLPWSITGKIDSEQDTGAVAYVLTAEVGGGQRQNIDLKVTLAPDRLVLGLHALRYPLDNIVLLGQKLAGFSVGGGIDIDAEVEFNWPGAALQRSRLTAASSDLVIAGHNLRIAAFGAGPAAIEISGDASQMKFIVSDVSLNGPPALGIKRLEGIGTREDETGSLGVRGRVRYVLPEIAVGPERFLLQNNEQFSQEFAAAVTPEYWSIDLMPPPANNGEGKKNPYVWLSEKSRLGVDGLGISAKFKGAGDGIDVQAAVAVANARAARGDMSLTVPEMLINMKSAVSLKKNVAAEGMQLTFGGRAPAVRFAGPEEKADVGMQLQGEISIQDGVSLASGVIEFSKGSYINSRLGLSVEDCEASLPVSRPLQADQKGAFSARHISLGQLSLGAVELQLSTTKTGYSFKGEHRDILDLNLGAGIEAEIHLTGEHGIAAKGHYRLPDHEINGVELGRLTGLGQGAYLAGVIGAEGDFEIGAGNRHGAFGLTFNRGTLTMPANNVLVENLALDIAFPDLPRFTSDEGVLSFDRAGLGEFHFSDGKISFMLESPETLLVANSRFDWCGGRVYTRGERFSTRMTSFDLVLYCDRIKLAELLKQFGFNDVEGEGTVNGQIPIGYNDGIFSFNEGFLYSTPGDGGTVKVRGADLLTGGMPANTPQFAQIDFAAAALKDFQYNWVKLGFESQGDDLVMQLRLDGKPSAPLPFQFDKQLGTYARMKVGAKGGIDRPIVLDVNFRLPFNEILGYGKNVRQMMNRFK